ncbi:MAG: P-loop NTPase [Enhygromyxa sp.]
MISFDEVVPTLVRAVVGHTSYPQIQRICVVRDLRGCVRLAIEPRAENDDFGSLEADLTSSLAGYFHPPIVTSGTGAASRNFVTKVFEQASSWPSHWPDSVSDPLTGAETTIDCQLWFVLERLISKHSWLLEGQGRPPWPLRRQTPAIIAFYSFKGGVGRSTLVGIVAWHLARAGHNVVVLDLDLEAPGIGALLGAETARGVIDYIIDHAAAGRRDLHGCSSHARTLDDAVNKMITVVPAGNMDWSYLEKLGRLDFVGTRVLSGGGNKSPTLQALEALLKTVKVQLQPEFILVDSRAGLHDIGGLSLHDLSHIDVLVSRASEQNYKGMKLTLQALATRKPAPDQRFVVAHSMAPPLARGETRRNEIQQFREKFYDVFQECIYSSVEDDDPSIDDNAAPHYPQVLSRNEDLDSISVLTPAHESVVFSDEFRQLVERVREMCAPESDDVEGDTPE